MTVRYPDLLALIRDLRAMGETNVLAGHVRPLTRGILTRAAELYAERYAEADGRIPATFEIVHLAGWAPHESQQKPLPRGSAKMRLADALGVQGADRRRLSKPSAPAIAALILFIAALNISVLAPPKAVMRAKR